MKRFLIKSIIFSALFVLSYFVVSSVMVRKGNGYGTDVISFYKEKRNSLDLVFFGSSHTYSTFSPVVLENVTGLKSYNFSTQQQPMWITYHYMKEVLKYQKPKYFVLDILMTSVNVDYMEEGVNRDALDKMRFSFNKIQAINASVEKNSDRISYYFNLIKYHGRWNELQKNDVVSLIISQDGDNKGFTFLEGNTSPATKYDLNHVVESSEISDKNKLYLNKIIELAKENDIELILVKTPCTTTEEQQKYYNYVGEIAKENNIKFLNYNLLYDELHIDFINDFYDAGHLNGSAAERVTEHFANYLKMNYNL